MMKLLRNILLIFIPILFVLFGTTYAEPVNNFWIKGANGQLYTNSGNGQGNAIINVAGCNGCGGGGGGGTVTSVGLALPAAVFNISGSPVTNTGTLTGTFDNQSANTFFAGPTNGAATTPGFRALVTADLPAGVGTVTSVGLSGGATGLSITGSPVTTSGVMQIGGILALGSGGLGTNVLASTPIFSSGITYDVVDGGFRYTSYGAGFTYDHATHTLTSTTPLNQVTGALAGGAAQDSFNNKIDWQWNSLGNNIGLSLSSNGTQALTGQNLFSVSVNGLNTAGNTATIAGKFSNTHSGLNASNTALELTASGASSNTALNITAGNIIQSGGSIQTSSTITINNSTTLTGGGVNVRFPTTNVASNGKFVQTDGSGNWEYANAPGSPSSGSAGDVQLADGSGGFSGSGNFNYDNGSQILNVAGQSIFTLTSGPAVSVLSDYQSAFVLSGNSFSGLSLTSGGLSNNEVGLVENDNLTFIASHTFRDDAGTGTAAFLFANRALIVDSDNKINWFDFNNLGYKTAFGNLGLPVTTTVSVNGSLSTILRTFTSAPLLDTYTVLPDDYTILANSVANQANVVLPDPSLFIGRIVIVKNIDATTINNTVITVDGGGTIEDTTSVTLGPMESGQYQSDGSKWWIISKI